MPSAGTIMDQEQVITTMEPAAARKARRTRADRLSRRGVAGMLALAVGGGLLTACSRPAQPTQAPEAEKEPAQPVTLEFWPHWGGPSREPAYQVLISAFTADNPKI